MLEPAIAKIFSRGKQLAVGCGVAVAPRGYVVTCAHVVADALGIPRNAADAPQDPIDLAFPFNGHACKARVIAWSSIDDLDAAVLSCAVPDSIRPVPLFQAPLTRAQKFRAFGFPKGYSTGRWGYGELRDAVPGGQVQVSSSDLAPGFSGGPVEDLQMGRLVGLLSSYDAALGTGFLIPSGQVARVCPELQIVRMEGRFSPLSDGLMGLPGDPLTGLEQFLQEYLGAADRPKPFGGRQVQFDQLNEWLATPSEPVAAIIAPAGRGKSALLTRWIARIAAEKRADVAFVPVSIRFNTSQKLRFSMLLGARLTYLAEGSARKLASSDPDQWIGEIGERLRESRPAGELPLLVVLDGLDEATDWRAGSDLNIPSTLGDGVKVLISARILAQDGGPEEWIRRLGWPVTTRCIALPPLSSAGVADVLRSMGDPLQGLAADIDLVFELTRLSEGDPLLVSLYVEALRGSEKHGAFLKPEELLALESGLDGYFDAWWRDQRRQWGARSPLKEAGVLAVLNILACALGPLGEADLLDLAVEEVNSWLLAETLETLGRFVIGNGRDQGFSFTHPRLSQYFYSHLSRPERDSWNQRFADYGRGVVQRLRSGALAPAEAPAYVLQNHTAHLERSGAPALDYYTLLEEHWVRAWERHDGSFTGYLRDVLRAWDIAERDHDLYRQIFCAFCHSSIVALHTAPPPVLIARALKEQLFNEAQVLGLMQQLEDERSQAEIVREVAPLLSTRGCQTAAALARGFTDVEARAAALSGLIAYLPEADATQLVQSAPMLDNGSQLLNAAVESAIARGSLPLLEDVLLAVEDYPDEETRADLMRRLIPHVSAASRNRLLSRAELFEEPAARAVLLAALSEYMSEDLLPAAVRAAVGIWYPYRRALALIALLEHAPESWKDVVTQEARGACDCISEEDRKAEVIIRLAAKLGEPESTTLLAQALDLIDDRVGGTRRTTLLSLFPHNLPEILSTAYTKASRRWTDPLQQIRLILRVARGARDPKPALRDALQTACGIQGGEKSIALELIAASSPPDFLTELLASVKAMPADLESMVVVASFLEPCRQCEILDGHRFSFENRDAAEALVARVAPRLGKEACNWLKLSTSAHMYSWNDYDRLQRFRVLVPLARVPEDLDELLSDTKEFETRPARSRALDLLTPHLDHGRLGRAIDLAWRIGVGGPEWHRSLIHLQPEHLRGLQHDEVEAIFQSSLMSPPSSPVYLWVCAVCLQFNGDTQTALERLAQSTPEDRIEFLANYAPWLPSPATEALVKEWYEGEMVGAIPTDRSALLERLVSNTPNSCAHILFKRLQRSDVSLDLSLRLALRGHHSERDSALKVALEQVEALNSAEDRQSTITAAAAEFGTISIREFEAVLRAAGGLTTNLNLLGRWLWYANVEVRREFVPRALFAAAELDASAMVSSFEALVPLLPPEEAREAVRSILETSTSAARKWRDFPSWPAELQRRTFDVAATLLTADEAEKVTRQFGEKVPFSFRARWMSPEERSAWCRSFAVKNLWWQDEDVVPLLPSLSAEDAIVLLKHAKGRDYCDIFGDLLGKVDAIERSAFIRSLRLQFALSDHQLEKLAPLLLPSDVLFLLRNTRDWRLTDTMRAIASYLTANQVPGVLELAAKIDRDTDRIEVQTRLLARLSPAAFIEAFLQSDMIKGLRSHDPNFNSLRDVTIVEGDFEGPESFSRALRLMGSLDRPKFTNLLALVMRAAVELAPAQVIRGVLDASACTLSWWP
jgi:hypothetical protein